MASLTLPQIATALPESLYDQLASSIRGPIFRPGETDFFLRSKTFNGKLIPRQKLVVSPLDAEDVSTIVKFCVKHSLSPSVRAGGYGIAGWAVAGDVVIDMSLIKDIDIEPPLLEGEGDCRWTCLTDMLPPGSKGKGRAAHEKPGTSTQSQPRAELASTSSRKRGESGDTSRT
ncbi:hypothetical protein NM688_g2606 [Phlebia brevispora]|uniref:Uncharacterized protein n=1 Tax=Phlebia brevispora TaxID=194682 RepID=A0ACC1T882_9APHY|nr:hypothetical protein NM688_g2606 [Phlebia brevispora]